MSDGLVSQPPLPSSGPAVDDCFAHAGRLLPHETAIALLKARIEPVAGLEQVALDLAAGRIAARPMIAPHPVPLHTNAAVDGYAFASPTDPAERARAWPITGRAAAGHPFQGRCPPGAVVRALTGAVLPDGTDTVVMQEDVTLSPDGLSLVSLPSGLKRGANVRKAGEDVPAGRELFPAGHRLRPQDIAALASVGVDQPEVFRRLRIAVFSTGDEIRAPGSGPIGVGEVYDANAPMLAALARSGGAEVSLLGILPDQREVVTQRLAEAARSFDVVLTSGGASRGEEDHVAAALAELGSRHFWQIAVKPGRPMMFGQIGRTVVVGLPGNPVAVFVCYLMYVHPMLGRLGGSAWHEPRRWRLPARFSFENRKLGRREFWRGRMVAGPDGWGVEKFERDGSGLISGLRVANGLIDVPEHVPAVRVGDLVDFIPFSEFGMDPNAPDL